jgi:hypothetical protein
VKDDRHSSGSGSRGGGPRNQGDARSDDETLRGQFAALRREDEQSVPGFAGLWRVRPGRVRPGRVRPRSSRRWDCWLAAAACVVVILAGLLWLRSVQPGSNVERTVSITEWKAPTDFLLETPGRELLRTVPRLESNVGGLGGYIAPKPQRRPSPVTKQVLP